jgi:four helix bundle protein
MQILGAMSHIAEELRQRTLRYTVGIVGYCRTLPDHWVAREIGKQLLRAGMGVSGNYWSACRGRSHAEFVAKLGVATDEAEENVLWLTVISRSRIRDDAETADLLGEGRELRAILATSARTARENNRRDTARRPFIKSPGR